MDRKRLLLVKRDGAKVSHWCFECDEPVAMLTPDEAATLGHVSSRTIYQRVEAGEVHYTETPEGFLLVCANSVRTDGDF